MTTYIIPDTHGCLAEAKQLVGELNLQDGDTIIHLGDMIDKGPESAGVVKYFRSISEQYNFIFIQGNHEEMFIRWFKKPVEKRPVMKRHEDFQSLLCGLDEKDIEFLQTSVLYHQFQIGDKPYIALHGGIPASLEESYETLPSVEEVAGFSNKVRRRFSQFLRLRYQTPLGKFIALGNEAEDSIFWSESYSGKFGFAFYGHQPYHDSEEGYFTTKHACGLDGGCVFGGVLNCVKFDSDGSWDVIQVQSHKKYAEPLM